MRNCSIWIVIFVVTLFIFSCSDENTGPENDVVNTEIWNIIIDGRAGMGTWIFELWSDSTIKSSGSWIYEEVSCDFVSAPMAVNGTEIFFEVNGTAHNSYINQDSDFAMTVTGNLLNGSGDGEYNIVYTAPQWPQLEGVWEGTLAEGEGVTSIIPAQEFNMHFIDNYIKESGWAILLTGEEVFFQEVSGDGVITFEDILYDRGTVIIIQNYYRYGNRCINITADEGVPLDDWYLKGYNYSSEPLGEYEVTLTFPLDDYTKCMTAPSYSSYTYPYSFYDSVWVFNQEQYYLEADGSICFFNAVYNSDTGNAYCGWEFDLPFEQGQTNYYDFSLDHPMQSKTVTTNIPVDYSYVTAYRNNYMSRNTLHAIFQSEDAGNEFMVFYVDEFPHETYDFSIYGYNDSAKEHYSYTKMGEDLPANITFPDYELSANFNYSTNRFEDVSVDDQADQIAGYWEYDDGSIDVSLMVYTHSNQEVIEIPEIPAEILDNLEIDLDQLILGNIGITNYDTAENFDDIINLVFQQQLPFSSLFNEKYSLRKYEDSNLMQKQKELDIKNNQIISGIR